MFQSKGCGKALIFWRRGPEPNWLDYYVYDDWEFHTHDPDTLNACLETRRASGLQSRIVSLVRREKDREILNDGRQMRGHRQ